MDALYKIHNLRKVYEGRTILDIEQLDVHEGEILAVVGPSGAGKSTLLRLLNFLEVPDEGTIHFQGKPVTRNAVPLETRRKVTTVFQHPALLSTNVINNIAYGLHLRGNRDGKAEITEVMARMGLTELAHAKARTLSGGEAQRVALARALVISPTVLLLDEPTANLDPYNIGLIERAVREMNEKRETTTVLVTHNIFQAKRLAHRVILLLGGKIVEAAETHAFFEAPRDPRTAAFVNGEMVY
ncbi:MAG: phosphate ABC transporter ATP-binding protein [Anaerolineae bacterium]|jgi:tungstate transport system ATP-binding protein|nr:phosphate ABC transporter ATP-binding protein [Anaerolineae bacterium]